MKLAYAATAKSPLVYNAKCRILCFSFKVRLHWAGREAMVGNLREESAYVTCSK